MKAAELGFTIRDDGHGGTELFIFRRADGKTCGIVPMSEAVMYDVAAEFCARLARVARRRDG